MPIVFEHFSDTGDHDLLLLGAAVACERVRRVPRKIQLIQMSVIAEELDQLNKFLARNLRP